MRKIRDRRPVPMDFDHMRLLHQEAIEQLELMRSVLESAEHATDIMRDNLDGIAINHWNAYQDVLHMICMHDEPINAIMKKYALKNDSEIFDSPERQLSMHRSLLLSLADSLLRRHRRIEHIFTMRGNPMTEYLKDSLSMEREHMADLISMMQSMI